MVEVDCGAVAAGDHEAECCGVVLECPIRDGFDKQTTDAVPSLLWGDPHGDELSFVGVGFVEEAEGESGAFAVGRSEKSGVAASLETRCSCVPFFVGELNLSLVGASEGAGRVLERA